MSASYVCLLPMAYCCFHVHVETADREELERVQNLAIWFVSGRYDRNFSSARMKELLQWGTLDC